MNTTYKLKSVIRRGTLLGAAFALLAATLLPSIAAYADALNPLTDRSLTLSSSSPGWDFLDGSGNPTFAQPNSGANGRQTGNTFEFKVSTDSSATGTDTAIEAFTFQYCTTSAGLCRTPGNNQYVGTPGSYTDRETNAEALAAGAQRSDLEVVAPSASELTAPDFASLINATAGVPTAIPNRDGSEGSFLVMTKDVAAGTWSPSYGWSLAASSVEDGSIALGTSTETNNFITLTNSSSTMKLKTGGEVKIIFFATDDNYITNPGQGAFFVKINNYNSSATQDDTTLVDGGVTVANVMNRSISIQTKVLETMDFSVGTVDPYTLTSGVGSQLSTATSGNKTTHGQCDPILPTMTPGSSDPANAVNTLLLGDANGEFSLSTAVTYSTHSYWRLSSNSSAGATVYYSGVTLQNTVGDKIDGIGNSALAPQRGTPQFGLALANGNIDDNLTDGSYLFPVDYDTETYATPDTTPDPDLARGVFENGADNAAGGLVGATQGIHSSVATDISNAGLAGYHDPQLYPLIPAQHYDDGAGVVNGPEYGTLDTKFAFDEESNLIPRAIASENDEVVDCVTAKIRYVANIAATTPAGIYTTKINYIAAPQY